MFRQFNLWLGFIISMARLVSNPVKNGKKTLNDKRTAVIDKIQASVLRGELLRYSLFSKEVKENVVSLKKSNPKYLQLIVDIIKISMTQLNGVDVIVPLKVLLPQLNEASFYNHEALDFTVEVLDNADILTAKYYLSYLAAGILSNKELKKQFCAAIPFVKYIVSSLPKNSDTNLARQIEFMNALKVIINKNASSEKIAILPKLKYLADMNFDNGFELDVVDILYGKNSVSDLIEFYERKTNHHHLTQNSL